MWAVTPYDDQAAKAICYDCGSPVAKQSYNYFRRIAFAAGNKVWSRVYSRDGFPVAFYYATPCRDHVRLIEIAVRSSEQGKGIGKMVLFELLSEMRDAGLYKLTFRTPIAESAQQFWLHIGARIVDVKGTDYEMELTIE